MPWLISFYKCSQKDNVIIKTSCIQIKCMPKWPASKEKEEEEEETKTTKVVNWNTLKNRNKTNTLYIYFMMKVNEIVLYWKSWRLKVNEEWKKENVHNKEWIKTKPVTERREEFHHAILSINFRDFFSLFFSSEVNNAWKLCHHSSISGVFIKFV